jgi:hypothetical protein
MATRKKRAADGELTVHELRAMLRSRYRAPVWAAFEEVPNDTSQKMSRACDFMALSLWDSKAGDELHGFEIKMSRADWLHELRDPDKADAFRCYCDRWWLVVPNRSIVKADELPADWGMLWVRGGKLVIHRGAPKFVPERMSRRLLRGMLRRAQDGPTDAALKQAHKDGFAEGRDSHAKGCAAKELVAEKELEYWKEMAERFEQETGVHLSQFNAKAVGRAVKVVMDSNDEKRRVAIDLEMLVKPLERLLKTAKEASGLLRDEKPKT